MNEVTPRRWPRGDFVGNTTILVRQCDPDRSWQTCVPQSCRSRGGQKAVIEPFLSHSRWRTYADEAARAGTSAEALYSWNSQMSAALFEVLGHLECALRESVDCQLRTWNSRQGDARFVPGVAAGPDWALPSEAAAPLRSLVSGKCTEARSRVRKSGSPSHDDIVAQLSFGAWVSLIPRSSRNSHAKQWRLWDEAIVLAFPGLRGGSPRELHRRLAKLQELRNRIAHHENLLSVNPVARLGDVLAILAAIDQQLADHVAGESWVRKAAETDPRRLGK